jgi:hypothetical protein
VNPGKLDFDFKSFRLPQIALVGFAVGIVFHACVVFSILDDGSSADGTSGTNEANVPREEVTLPTATATPDPRADRTDCAAIRTSGDYRSENERQWFLRNCTGG